MLIFAGQYLEEHWKNSTISKLRGVRNNFKGMVAALENGRGNRTDRWYNHIPSCIRNFRKKPFRSSAVRPPFENKVPPLKKKTKTSDF
jgi:hypothetical protein